MAEHNHQHPHNNETMFASRDKQWRRNDSARPRTTSPDHQHAVTLQRLLDMPAR
jgi:hypothetical protein